MEIEMSEISEEYFDKVFSIGMGNASPIYKEDQTGQLILVPDGMKVHEIADKYHLPEEVHENISIFNQNSFIEYINYFANSDGRTVVFADNKKLAFEAIVDYHEARDADVDGGKRRIALVRRASHRSNFKPLLDESFSRWREISGKWLSQLDMAHFLEENAHDLFEPDAASVMELVQSFEAKTDIDFKKAINLSNTTTQITYHEKETRTPGQIIIPKFLKINAPVFFGGEPREMQLFFRYSARDGNLKFKLDLHRETYIIYDAFEAIAKEIVNQCAVPVYFGSR
jgi:hypothetical protein